MSRRFTNPWTHPEHRFRDVLRWKLGLGPPEECPEAEAEGKASVQASAGAPAPDEPAGRIGWTRQPLPEAGWRVTWLGHASFLLEGCGRRLLVDPIFSDHCAPLPLPSLRRHVPPPCSLDELGPVDAVLVSHSHYDHLDLPTLRRIGGERPVVLPEGHAAWLGGQGFRNPRELAWFGEMQLFPGIRVTATPAQHFTARTPFDRNRGHWCGFRIDGGGVSLWHAGDSGYCPAFREIGERLGPADFGMIPIGAYAPRWFMRPVHMTPEEAVEVFRETGCARAVGMHWGTFRLTDEPLGEPPRRLAAAAARAGITSFVVGKVGESWRVSEPESESGSGSGPGGEARDNGATPTDKFA